jgi:hypothetical protein
VNAEETGRSCHAFALVWRRDCTELLQANLLLQAAGRQQLGWRWAIGSRCLGKMRETRCGSVPFSMHHLTQHAALLRSSVASVSETAKLSAHPAIAHARGTSRRTAQRGVRRGAPAAAMRNHRGVRSPFGMTSQVGRVEFCHPLSRCGSCEGVTVRRRRFVSTPELRGRRYGNPNDAEHWRVGTVLELGHGIDTSGPPPYQLPVP